MSKKNTVLYLDENLIDKARKRNLNLSQIMEIALKQHLFPYLSTSERIAIDFDEYLENLKREKRCFLLPCELKRLRLRNVGFIKNLDVEFQKVTIILGRAGTGKTTIIRSIAYMLGLEDFPESQLLKDGFTRGKIELDVVPKKRLNLSLKAGGDVSFVRSGKDRCILLDAPGDIFDSETFKKFLHHLMGFDLQIVMTTAYTNDKSSEIFYKMFPKCRVIELR